MADGVNAEAVASRLGHGSTAMTLDVYSHALPGMQKDALERLEGS